MMDKYCVPTGSAVKAKFVQHRIKDNLFTLTTIMMSPCPCSYYSKRTGDAADLNPFGTENVHCEHLDGDTTMTHLH